MIPPSFIQDLLNRVDIVDVVQRYVPLKKAGANYAACCPFHTEKTPSFTVSPSKQFYHCFGCGAHGTAIGFVMEYAGMGFVEAVKELAAGVGMTVPAMPADASGQTPWKASGGGDEGGSEALLAAMQRATQYYRNELKGSEAAIGYLKNRGLSGEIAARFGIGYAPPGWQNLAQAFPDYASKVLERCGLVVHTEEGKRYDRFRDRIMFPIQNQRGMVIAFGGRVLGQGEPKYLNSPETPLFEKGRELYGLGQARQAIREAGRVLVVEGYMDVVALAQYGVGYGVATLGTATTPLHVQKLLRQSDDVVFCFDGDEAGRRAAWRALENSLEWLVDGKHISFLFLPQGEDPDSYVRQAGKAGLEALLKTEAISLSGFLLRGLSARADTRTREGRARLLQLARPLLGRIKAPALHLMIRKQLAELAGISQAELEELFQIKRTRRAGAPPHADRKLRSTLSRRLLQWILFQPPFAQRVDTGLLDALDSDTETLAAVLEFLRSHPQISYVAALVEHFRDSPHEPLLRQVAGEIMEWGEDLDLEAEAAAFEAALEQLRDKRRKKRVDELLHQARSGSLSEQGKLELQQLLQRDGIPAQK